MERAENGVTDANDGEVHDTGLGGTTGGGVLGGGTPTDIIEGRSAIHIDEHLSREEEESRKAVGEPGGGAGADAGGKGAVPIDHNPATSAGTTDAGLRAGGGTDSLTGGLISGGLPGEDTGEG
jgi:hypothetical protein